MKLLTINTHSLIEKEYEKKLTQFVEMIAKERPDIIAMQEVNQLASEAALPDFALDGFVRNPEFTMPVREGNHAARVAALLREKGIAYSWTWISAKLGYEKYDEGLAVFSLRPITATDQIRISQTADYKNWKTRKCVGIQVQGLKNVWFYTVHMGWWDDAEEPFSRQCDTLMDILKKDGKLKHLIWLMGDFNSPSTSHGQGYTCMRQNGWLDSYQLAFEKDRGVTVEAVIDGWHDRADQLENSKKEESGMRLDYLFCNQYIPVASSKVVFNGKNYPLISDHYGVMIEVAESNVLDYRLKQ